MARIKSIADINDKYQVVYLDDGFLFKGKKWEIRKLNLDIDMLISPELYEQIYKEYGVRRCRYKAVDILSGSDKTEFELKRKLKDSYFAEEVIEEVIAELKRHHYVDDMRYASNFVNYKSGTKSRFQIISLLKSKGVDNDIINNVIANEYNSKDEYIIIRKQLNKYADVDNNINREHINKIYSSLVRKGISYSLIEDIISNEYNLI